MQMIATITRPTSGRISFPAKTRDSGRNRCGRGSLSADFGVYDNLTARSSAPISPT